MFRLVIILGVLLLVGVSLLSNVSSDLADELVFFVFWILVLAVVLKVSLDFILHFKKEDEDSETDELLDEDNEEAYNNIEDYLKARNRREKSRKF